jgi:hypothetical protein
MNSEDLALHFSDEKPGYELVGYAAVAVPLYRLALSTITLERKRIPPVSEFVLRSIGIGVSDPAEIKNLLGLTREMVNETVVTLAHEDYVAFTRDADGKAGIVLTPKGQHGVEEATAVSAQTRDAELDYDALLGQPVPFSIGFLEPRELDAAALRDLPPSAEARKLAAHHLEINALVRLGRIYGVPRDVPTDVLTIEKVKRRRRLFREALALLFVGTGNEFHVAFALDGVLSSPHEEAFARAGLAKHFGIDAAKGVPPITDAAADVVGDLTRRWDRGADFQTRAAERVRLRRELAKREGLPLDPTASGEAPDDGCANHDDQPARLLECFQLGAALTKALRTAEDRLVILSERLASAVVSEEFISSIARLTRAGVRVCIGWGLKDRRYARTECDREAIARLAKLEQAQTTLTVRYLENAALNTLIVDRQALVLTRHEWLASSGMPVRTLADQRGVALQDDATIESEVARLTTLFDYGIEADELGILDDRRPDNRQGRQELGAGP